MPETPRPRPHFEVFEGGAGSAHPPTPRPPRRRNWIAWILGALLALALGGVYQQQQTQAALETRIQGLTADLAASQKLVESHRSHLGDVRAALADLEAVVSRDPEAQTGR